uniref:Replication protein 1a n=1 Tax=Uromyces anulavirus A TaxID=2592793 RepID=A0A7G3KG93_9BROM|nr:putative RdRp [Uromyces anulavirus A]
MDTLFRHEILYDTLRSAVEDLGLDDEDIDTVVRTLMPVALEDESFLSKFNYALTPESYHTRAVPSDAEIVGRVRSSVIPKLELPIYSFKRNTKPVISLKARLTPDEIKFFNYHYSSEFILNYGQCIPHDHAAAAMSRKIEYDFVLKYCWEKYCNPLLLPTNYDFSVIDVGGDWSTILSRKQYGMHCCNPLLDERDRARDTRRKARDNTDFYNTAYVCHDTFQQCSKTAPVAISIHSSYDIRPEEIVSTMAKRGISNYVGSMFLPRDLDVLERFTDVDYGFNVFVDRTLDLFDQLVSKFSKYSADVQKSKKRFVVYTFPNGESREYCHDLDNLLKYSNNRTYYVYCQNMRQHVTFEYRIMKRVGSLIYFEFVQNFELPPANLRISTKVDQMPYDGYRVKLESSFLASSYLQIGSPNYVYVPRGLFDTVANYCLTRITSEDFTIEHAITYVRSIMSSLQINESLLNLHNNDESFSLMITCGLAAYQWAHERFRLLESRVPYKAFLEKYISSSEGIASLCNSILNTDKIFAEARTLASNVASSVVSDVLMNNPSTRVKIDNALRAVNSALSPCILEIVDMHLMVSPINIIMPPVHTHRRRSDLEVNLRNVHLTVPTYADYNQTVLSSIGKRSAIASKYVEAKTLIDEIINKRFDGTENERNTLRPSPYEIEPTDAANILNENETAITQDVAQELVPIETDEIAPITHDIHRTEIYDFIRLAEETDLQQIEQAQMIVEKAINKADSTVPTLLPLQADQKCSPLVISVQQGVILGIKTLETTYHAGTPEIIPKLANYDGHNFCTRFELRPDEPDFKIIRLVKDKFYYGSQQLNRTFDCIYVPEIQLLLGNMYKALRNRIKYSNLCRGTTTATKLINGVAGCGKTHMQVMNYIADIHKGRKPAIFSATRAAAQQAHERIIANGEAVIDGSVSTVDSFLMHPSRWKSQFTHIYVDEALQLHSGKLRAILELLNPKELTGFGDERQITFINFSRISDPTVDTKFPWVVKDQVWTTRRIPDGPRIEWLRHKSLYGESFTTYKSSKDIITVFAEINGLEKLISAEWLYRQVNLPMTAPLLVLVYRADVANDLRMRMQVTRTIPDASNAVRLAVATIGESQGEDVPNSLLLRLSSKEETLYTKDDQTIVGLTRSSSSWGYLTVPSNFPSLLEKVIYESNNKYKLRRMT